MNKFTISPNKAKVISSFLITTIISLLLLFLLRSVISSRFEETQEQYIESCQNIASGYAYAINNKLENYLNLLGCYYLPEIYENATPKEIQQTLIDLIPFNTKAAPDFHDVFYVDHQGIGYSQSGQRYSVTDRDYYYACFLRKYNTYINSPIISKTDGIPEIVLCQSIKNSEGKIKGILCASVKLSTFSSIFNNSELTKIGQIILLDEKGRFIIHQDKNWLFQTFDPIIYGVEERKSLTIAKTINGNYKTVDVYGTPIRLFCSKLDQVNWTLCLKVSLATEIEIQNKYKRDILCVMFSIFFVILILVISENWVFNVFQKHQLIKTIYDPLTNLWTREHFEYEASKWIKRSARSKFILIECDIRGFKFVNQNSGELSANKMLVRFSKILSKYVEDQHGYIGRGFADRFYILCKTPTVRKAMNYFKAVLPEFNEKIKDYDLPFFPKFGITFLMPETRRKTVSIQGLIGQASFAKTTIKDNMMVQYAIYNSRLVKKINQEQFIEQHMEQALKNGEFFVMYQPKISLVTEKIVGAEALVRWNSAELGLLSPDKFIPLFEKNGFITTLDFFVYEQVFKFMEKNMSDENNIVPVSLNMSRNHSKPDKFMHQLMNIFKKYNIPPNYIQIEILERSFMDNNKLKEITTNLHNEGFTVAMDDFGSGESSLNMLTKIPVDVLKFDRAFLQSSTNEKGEIDEQSAGFIEILIELSKHLNKETVFEGVETLQQRDFLKSIKCDQAQGFFYSRPLTEQDFLKFMNEHS